MSLGHLAWCTRRIWLSAQPKNGLFWVVLFQEGPACDCPAGGPTVQALNSRDGVTGEAGVPPTGVNNQVRGASAG